MPGFAGSVTTMRLPKRLLFGHPMSTDQLRETLLPKRLALPVYCSDPISSNAYATQEILLVLALGGASMVLLPPGWRPPSYPCSRWSRSATGRPATPIRTAVAPTRSVGPTSAGTRPWWPRRPAGRLRDDRGGLGRLRGGNFVSAFPALAPTRRAVVWAVHRVARSHEPTRGARVGDRVRDPHLRVRGQRVLMLGVGFWNTLAGNTPVAESAASATAPPTAAGAALTSCCCAPSRPAVRR